MATNELIEETLVGLEKIVLESELFLREAKQLMLTAEFEEHRSKFYSVLARSFEDGNSVEIIDGDIDQVESVSFMEVISWVQ